METINIVFSSDNNYAQFMGVAICSIFENKKEDYLIDIYVLDGGIKEDNKIKLKVLEDRYNFKINYIKIDTDFFKDFFISRQITQASYYRIIIPDLLPNISKIIYLDCDIVVINDIYELFNINIDNYYFAAVDEENYIPEKFKKLKIPKYEPYFNAGVMLINLDKWRKNNISKKLTEYIIFMNNKLDAHDQDAMNAVLYGKWLPIEKKYNYMTSFRHKYSSEENIHIIHYIEIKPWKYLSINPFNKEYFYYLKKTPWKDIKYVDKNILIQIIKRIIILVLSDKIIKKIKILILKK